MLKSEESRKWPCPYCAGESRTKALHLNANELCWKCVGTGIDKELQYSDEAYARAYENMIQNRERYTKEMQNNYICMDLYDLPDTSYFSKPYLKNCPGELFKPNQESIQEAKNQLRILWLENHLYNPAWVEELLTREGIIERRRK